MKYPLKLVLLAHFIPKTYTEEYPSRLLANRVEIQITLICTLEEELPDIVFE